MSDLFDKCRTDGGYFGGFRARGDMYFTQPVLEGTPGPRMKFHGREVMVWALNSYLGIAGRPDVDAAAADALRRYGPSAPMGSRMLTGNTAEHIELERRFAAFCGKPASIVFNYGYLGVIGTVSALVGKDDTIVIDSLSHASMIDATMLASGGRRFHPYKHNDMNDLESHLRAADRDRKGGILVITEGVFGMKGNCARLPESAGSTRSTARASSSTTPTVSGSWGRTAGERASTSGCRTRSTSTSAPSRRRSPPSGGDGRGARRGGVDPLQRRAPTSLPKPCRWST